ncbi:MAG: hypothetical protein IJ658_12835, partial [Kiritimatiellae bacterium]|nr:hypothetical protein [Kiritimatiellia bacterium]
CRGWRVTSSGLIALMRPGALLQNIKPKRRSWILVSSRKDCKDCKDRKDCKERKIAKNVKSQRT